MANDWLLGSDNGHVYSVPFGGGTARHVHTLASSDESPGFGDMGWFSTDPNDMSRVVLYSAWLDDAIRSNSGGASWTEEDGTANISNSRPFGRDETTGDLFTRGSLGIYKSTDNGITWTLFHATPVGESLFCVWAQDGYVWWVEGPNDVAADKRLKRIALDGTGEATLQTGLTNRLWILGGRPGTGLIFLWSAGDQIHSIPPYRIETAGPTITALSYPALDVNEYVQWMVPISSTRAVLHASHTGGDGSPGSIWISDDAGDTWTKIVDDAELSHEGYISAQTAAVDQDNPTHVAVLGNVPYYWESADSGDTWTKRTLSPQAAAGDFQWRGVGFAAYTCTPVLLIGSDTGHIYRRVGNSGTPTLAYTNANHTSSNGSAVLTGLSTDPTDLRQAAFYFLDFEQVIHSEDAGASWTEETGGDIESGLTFSRDPATGDLYNADYTNDRIAKSTDNGATWSAFLSATNPFHVCAQDGYVYYTHQSVAGFSNDATLRRIGLDGSGDTELTNDLNGIINPWLQGNPASGVIYLFSMQSTDHGKGFFRIDSATGAITELAAPTLPTNHRIHWIVPLSATRAVMQTWSTAHTDGAIYVTTDGGANWTQVELDADLDLLWFPGNGASVVVSSENNAHLVAAGKISGANGYYWESTDSGDAWTKKTITTSEDFGWTMIAFANTCAGGGGDDGGEEPLPFRRRLHVHTAA